MKITGKYKNPNRPAKAQEFTLTSALKNDEHIHLMGYDQNGTLQDIYITHLEFAKIQNFANNPTRTGTAL